MYEHEKGGKDDEEGRTGGGNNISNKISQQLLHFPIFLSNLISLCKQSRKKKIIAYFAEVLPAYIYVFPNDVPLIREST